MNNILLFQSKEFIMKLIASSGKNILKMTKTEWEKLGTEKGWMKVEVKKDIDVEAKKKKKWNPNPWAVCTESVGREDKKKYERCVMDVKEKQK